MAGLRAGLIDFSCERCKEAPYIKEAIGCDKPTKNPAKWWHDDEFYNCPIRFIMQSTYEFLEKIDSYRSGLSTPPDYEKQSARFLLAIKVFDHYIYKFTQLKQGK